MRFARTRETWNNGYVPIADDFASIDEKTKKALNADEGGTWAPSAPIIVGGQGLQARLRFDHIAVGPNTTTTFSATSSRLVYLDATITINRDYALSSSGALDGDTIEFLALPTMLPGKLVNVYDYDSGTLLADVGYFFGAYSYARFVFVAGAWRLLGGTRNGPLLEAKALASAPSPAAISGATTDVAGSELVFDTAIAEGDQLLLDAFGTVTVSDHSGLGGYTPEYIRITKDDNTVLGETNAGVQATGAYTIPWSISARYVVTSGDRVAGNVSLKLRHAAAGSGITGSLFVAGFRGIHVRT